MKIFISDFIPRCGINTKEKIDESAKDVVHCIGEKELHISEEKMLSIKNETLKNECLKIILKYCPGDQKDIVRQVMRSINFYKLKIVFKSVKIYCTMIQD